MSNLRDEFSKGVRQVLAHRAGFRCSKPDCRAPTAGPSDDPNRQASIGIAAHVTAAAPGGPRYDEALTPDVRASVANGIWLCDTHGREVDRDPTRFSVELLFAWKTHAEEQARAMLGRPLSGAPLDVVVDLGLVRSADDHLLVVGETNLPDGTKLMATVRNDSMHYSAQAKCSVANRRFALGAFSNHGDPLPQDWYAVEVCAYFNGAWQQPLHVVALAGKNGSNLAGSLAQVLDPDIDDSDIAVDASFDCPAPPRSGELPLTEVEVGDAAALLQNAILSVGGHDPPRSAEPVGRVVASFMTAPGLRPYRGWETSEVAPGLVRVTYSYMDGEIPRLAEWQAMPRAARVKYRNRAAKYMSWSPEA